LSTRGGWRRRRQKALRLFHYWLGTEISTQAPEVAAPEREVSLMITDRDAVQMRIVFEAIRELAAGRSNLRI